tara:strand:+ start:964 stop:1710 length:747 start_codon:yes stop_codon:yes gene_type:complete
MIKILVIGDSCVDKFIYGNCDRICPEAPVPVFNPINITENGGMAKNVQSNIKSLDVYCDIMTNEELIVKTRYVDSKTNQMLIRVDEHDYVKKRINLKKLKDVIHKYDSVVVVDYDKGFLNEDDLKEIVSIHKNVFFHTKKKLSWNYIKARFIQINQYEYKNTYKEVEDMKGHIEDKLIVTYGDKGCYHQRKLYPPSRKVEARDLSGAGDTFMAAFVVSITEGRGINTAIEFAQNCSADVVEKRGVVTI